LFILAANGEMGQDILATVDKTGRGGKHQQNSCRMAFFASFCSVLKSEENSKFMAKLKA
jgi:hypothetical protein